MATEPLTAAIVGAQKSGTTALAEFLGTHPAIALPEVKELHAFDEDDHDWSSPDVHHLIDRHFAGVGPDVLRIDATPITMYWPQAVERVVRLCPNIRAIVLLRDPVQRAWSHWRMEVAKGKDDLPFSTAIRSGRQRVRSSAPAGHHRVYSYVERGFYAKQLDHLKQHVPEARVMVVRQADLLGDHDSTLRRLHAFLEVPPQDPLPAARVVHTYREHCDATMSAADAQHLREVYAHDLDRLAHVHDVELRTRRDQQESDGGL